MQDCLLLILCISPLMGAGAIALMYTQSLCSIFVVLIGAIVGAIIIVFSGIFWLQVLHRDWIESQAAGFIFIPIILPFYGYTGAVAGASLVSILYGCSRNDMSAFLFQAIAVCFTVVLGGFIPSAIAAIPLFADSSSEASKEVERFVDIPLFAMCVGAASSGLASQLAYLLVTKLV